MNGNNGIRSLDEQVDDFLEGEVAHEMLEGKRVNARLEHQARAEVGARLTLANAEASELIRTFRRLERRWSFVLSQSMFQVFVLVLPPHVKPPCG
jgi:hypothetical protein